MVRAGRVVGGVVAAALLLGVGYGVADAYDVVPGRLTTAPRPQAPAFPTAPGAAPLAAATPALGALSDDAPAPSSGTVSALVKGLVSDDRMGSRTGVQVLDVATGDVLAASGATRTYVPASTQKLLTGAAALTVLDPDATLPTTVVSGGSGTIVLVGGGDQLLAAGKGSRAKIDGRAGVGDLAGQVADQLELQGTRSVRLVVDDSLFGGPALSPTWDPGYLANGFVAPVSALSIDVARVTPDEYAQRYRDPALRVADVFSAALEKRGVEVTRTSRGTAPDGARELGRVESAPVRDVVRYALEHSDNTVTEGLGRLVAAHVGQPATFAGATTAVLAAVRDLGVRLDGARLVDCSGLGEGSRLSPQQLVDVLRLATDGEHPRLTGMISMLPVAGLTGTLDDRFVLTDARGLVRAKTGSLTGVTSLAGTLVTHAGRQLVFVVLADRTPAGGQWGPRAAIDGFVARLVDS